jgi:transcriptional regulator with XRE-family HTH domain
MDIDEFVWMNRMSQRELADIIGIKKELISRYKCGYQSPSLLTALKLAYSTKGKVSFEEMLSKVDKQKWEEFLKKLGEKNE